MSIYHVYDRSNGEWVGTTDNEETARLLRATGRYRLAVHKLSEPTAEDVLEITRSRGNDWLAGCRDGLD